MNLAFDMISVHINGQIAFITKVDQVGVSANSPPPPWLSVGHYDWLGWPGLAWLGCDNFSLF